jgi:hypothetical protein
MRFLSPLLATTVLLACHSPVALVPNTRRVIYQPPPLESPAVPPGMSLPVRTRVGLVVNSEGLVTSVIPIEGVEPFLSRTIQLARQFRFTPGFPSTATSPIHITLTYQSHPTQVLEIEL